MRRSLALVGLLTAACVLVRPALASTITNGDFQTGTLAGWTVFTTSNGTTGGGLPIVGSFDTTGAGASDAAQFNVGEVTYNSTPQGGGLSQTFTAPVTGLYTLTEDFASLDSASGLTNSDAGTFSLILNGVDVASDSLGTITANQILRGSFDVTVALTAGSNTLETEITRDYISNGTSTPTEYLDNISLTPAVTATPEPSSFFLLGTALAALVRVSWRRNLSTASSTDFS